MLEPHMLTWNQSELGEKDGFCVVWCSGLGSQGGSWGKMTSTHRQGRRWCEAGKYMWEDLSLQKDQQWLDKVMSGSGETESWWQCGLCESKKNQKGREWACPTKPWAMESLCIFLLWVRGHCDCQGEWNQPSLHRTTVWSGHKWKDISSTYAAGKARSGGRLVKGPERSRWILDNLKIESRGLSDGLNMVWKRMTLGIWFECLLDRISLTDVGETGRPAEGRSSVLGQCSLKCLWALQWRSEEPPGIPRVGTWLWVPNIPVCMYQVTRPRTTLESEWREEGVQCWVWF
jgi:hypothetical protein